MPGRILRALLLAALVTAIPLGAETLPAPEMWTEANAAADSGDFDAANQRLNELLERGRAIGVARFPLLAKSAAALAGQAQQENNGALARWAIAAAERLDPASPGIAYAAADLAQRRNDWVGALRPATVGMIKTARDYSTRVLAQSDLVLVLAMAVGLLTAVFAVGLAFRYGRGAAHDFREMLGTRFSAGVTTVLAFSLLFLPIFLWLGPAWLILWWLALFFAYGSWKEKTITVILLLLVAAIPPVLERTSTRIAGLQSPVVRAAVAAATNSYDVEATRRLQALLEFLPEDPMLHLLIGNLYVQQGADSEASIHYRRAVQLDENLAGAHLNIGNLHFFNNDFTAAMSRYERAAASDPTMAIAKYNQSVAAGELYRFDDQRQLLDEARQRDRSLIDDLTSRSGDRGGLKVEMYQVPIATAWALSDRIARSGTARELYGNFAFFEAARSATNTLTIASLGALILAVVLWFFRRRAGLAGSCIKCGRTFCPRCKSARESATYCTQCIHIYLKRDGVSLDTKRKKLEEVHGFQGRSLGIRKLMGTFLPGASQIISGSTFAGVGALLLFLLFVSLAILIGRLAPLGPTLQVFRLVVRSAAILIALIVWATLAIPLFREKAGQ
jgi:tetratricopeptide (TPR) repeat protein